MCQNLHAYQPPDAKCCQDTHMRILLPNLMIFTRKIFPAAAAAHVGLLSTLLEIWLFRLFS